MLTTLGLTKTVALEATEHGITVNAICSGYVFTPLVEKQFEEGQGAERGAGHQGCVAPRSTTRKFVTTPGAEQVRDILEGGREVCSAAGIPVAGGHFIDTPESIYGLAVNGRCAPSELRRNCDAKPEDILILTKPVGVGVYSTAFKKDALSAGDCRDMIATMTGLNRVGDELAKNPDLHAMTDVTGFGILGHGLEIARGSGLKLTVKADSIPLLTRAAELVREGFVTGASGRNWDSYGHDVTLPADYPLWQRRLVYRSADIGWLLVACAPSQSGAILTLIQAAGFDEARIVGEMVEGSGAVVS